MIRHHMSQMFTEQWFTHVVHGLRMFINHVPTWRGWIYDI